MDAIVLTSLILTMLLVLVDFYYSFQSKKMLESKLTETKAEMVMASRPLLVARAVIHESAVTYEADIVSPPKGAHTPDGQPVTSHFSHFELFNAGNSPALDLEILLLDEQKNVLQGETLGFLRNNEQALTFVPGKLEPHKNYFLVCEYESTRSRIIQTWYQTWLPFTPVKGLMSGKINVSVSELDFKDVGITERIDVFKANKKLAGNREDSLPAAP
jgi:hypothetical protein